MSGTSAIPVTRCASSVWGTAAFALALAIQLGTSTSEGVTADLARVAARGHALDPRGPSPPHPAPRRDRAGARGRWTRRSGNAGAASASSACPGSSVPACGSPSTRSWICPRRLPDALTPDVWLISPRFPSLTYLAAATAAAMAGKPWLGRSWRRAADIGVAALAARDGVRGHGGRARAGRGGVQPERPPGPECSLPSVRRTGAPPPAMIAAGLRERRPRRVPTRSANAPRAAGSSSTSRTTVGRRPGLREGVRAGQPRRRSPLPRLPRPPPAQSERHVAVAPRSSTTWNTRRSLLLLASDAGVRPAPACSG